MQLEIGIKHYGHEFVWSWWNAI